MPIPPRRSAALAGQVFRGTDAMKAGLVTIDELRSKAWLRVRHDVYADARLATDHELACRAALARLPPTTVVAGPSAAYLHGVHHAATYADEVHVITPKAVRIGTQRRLRVHHLELSPREITEGRNRLTTPNRTAWDVARWLDPAAAVPVVDTLLALDLTTPDALADQVNRMSGQRGWRRAQRVFDLADGGARSPAESRLRLRLVSAGLPRPVTQCPIPVATGLILHVDLGWPEWRVALEYDGEWHADPAQFHRDRRRLNRLVVAGWSVLHTTSHRQRAGFPDLVREVRSALTANGWKPSRDR